MACCLSVCRLIFCWLRVLYEDCGVCSYGGYDRHTKALDAGDFAVITFICSTSLDGIGIDAFINRFLCCWSYYLSIYCVKASWKQGSEESRNERKKQESKRTSWQDCREVRKQDDSVRRRRSSGTWSSCASLLHWFALICFVTVREFFTNFGLFTYPFLCLFIDLLIHVFFMLRAKSTRVEIVTSTLTCGRYGSFSTAGAP